MAKLGIKGGRFQSLFHAVDWLPTLAKIAGATPNGRKPLHGVDQLSTLQGGAPSRTEMHLGYSDRKPPLQAFRYGEWKMMCGTQTNDEYLFNMLDDREENNNLAKTYPNIAAEIRQRMTSFSKEHFDGREKEKATCQTRTYDVTTWNVKSAIPWCI